VSSPARAPSLGRTAVLGAWHSDSGVEAHDPDDARLIAAAPELLDALEQLVYAANGQEVPTWEWGVARTAIAKAREGE
jgi:hypothetical protein